MTTPRQRARARRQAMDEGVKGPNLHLWVTAFTGTAKHLREAHGIADPDVDDPHGLAHDHAVLHGAHVTRAGNPVWPSPEHA